MWDSIRLPVRTKACLLEMFALGVPVFRQRFEASASAAQNQLEVMGEIQAHTRQGSLHYTDEWYADATLRTRGEHVMIRKEKGRPLGRDHIDGIEDFWSYVKNWLYPYRGVPTTYFHLYLAEACCASTIVTKTSNPCQKGLLTALSTPEINPILVRKA